jgi:hypothetical protein
MHGCLAASWLLGGGEDHRGEEGARTGGSEPPCAWRGPRPGWGTGGDREPLPVRGAGGSGARRRDLAQRAAAGAAARARRAPASRAAPGAAGQRRAGPRRAAPAGARPRRRAGAALPSRGPSKPRAAAAAAGLHSSARGEAVAAGAAVAAAAAAAAAGAWRPPASYIPARAAAGAAGAAGARGAGRRRRGLRSELTWFRGAAARSAPAPRREPLPQPVPSPRSAAARAAAAAPGPGSSPRPPPLDPRRPRGGEAVRDLLRRAREGAGRRVRPGRVPRIPPPLPAAGSDAVAGGLRCRGRCARPRRLPAPEPRLRWLSPVELGTSSTRGGAALSTWLNPCLRRRARGVGGVYWAADADARRTPGHYLARVDFFLVQIRQTFS